MLLSEAGALLASLSWIVILLIVLGIAVAASGIFVYVARIILVVKYKKYNKIEIQAGLTCEQSARAFLDAHGLQNVEVRQCKGLYRWILGNHYDVKHKIIWLRKNIMGKTTVTALGVALQKVTLAIEDSKNSKDIKLRGWMQSMVVFAPAIFVPFVLVGVIIDLVAGSQLGLGTIATTALGLVFMIMALIFTILNLKIEVRANNKTVELLQNSNLMTPDEIEALKGVYKAYKIAYIADFLQALFETIRLLVKLFGLILKASIKK